MTKQERKAADVAFEIWWKKRPRILFPIECHDAARDAWLAALEWASQTDD